MRVTVRAPGDLYDHLAGEFRYDPALVAALDGRTCETDNFSLYLDENLADLGIVGGRVRLSWTEQLGLTICVDYWSPCILEKQQIDALRDDTYGQLSDGLGENGFEIQLNDRRFTVQPNTDAYLDVDQIDDGVPVSPPSLMALSARDGNLVGITSAIFHGEAVDSQLQGYTALHLAILHRHPDAAILLIEKGADPNMRDHMGSTPLHLCALCSDLSDSESASIARALLAHGADPGIVDEVGDPASYYARDRGKIELLQVLEG